MEEVLEAAILGGANDEEIEFIILDNVLIDRDNVEILEPFDLEQMADEEVKLSFRFERNDIYRLRHYLGIPENVRTNTSNRVNVVENCGELLNDLNNLQWLNRDKLRYYAQAVQAKGGAVRNCWGFIDGTARQICRPTIDQEDLKGAYTGRRHDAGIFRDSGLYRELEQKAIVNQDEKYALYGDQAYGLMELLLTPYPGRPDDLLPHQREFNGSMKLLRVSVEWGFQKIKKPEIIIRIQDLDSMYKVAVLLTNCHTCLCGSQTATYFNTVPPTLEEYFGLQYNLEGYV
ncbi:hypothetical protein NQ315_003252 [Exocentrus adspersus]|uniref:DDE Tnp4 domain-containing protein n=1 Tax=Exocentrus adspersus TaxID=1586481 RepID=A0AAV8VCZ2_9CUCU|nr:hypothetical protein NQ315_003252 [Exocentrus adspersus]